MPVSTVPSSGLANPLASTTTTTSTITTLNAPSGVLATQNGMTGIPKAWVNFTVSGTSCVITSSFNVSSVTYNAVGAYIVNYTTTLNQTPCVVSIGLNNVSTPSFFDFMIIAGITTTQTNVNLRRWQSGSFSAVDNTLPICIAALA